MKISKPVLPPRLHLQDPTPGFSEWACCGTWATKHFKATDDLNQVNCKKCKTRVEVAAGYILSRFHKAGKRWPGRLVPYPRYGWYLCTVTIPAYDLTGPLELWFRCDWTGSAWQIKWDEEIIDLEELFPGAKVDSIDHINNWKGLHPWVKPHTTA